MLRSEENFIKEKTKNLLNLQQVLMKIFNSFTGNNNVERQEKEKITSIFF